MPIGNLLQNNTKSTHLTTFTIKVEGVALPVEFGVVQIDVERALNKIPTAHILLEDGNAASQKFEISSSSKLIPGKKIEILGGYSSDENSLFEGVITKHRVKVSRHGGSFLKITCKDPLFRLALDRKSRYLKELSDSDIFDEILNNYENTSADFRILGGALSVHKEIVQYQVSDWDFLMMRAEKMGAYCIANNGKLSIQKLPPVSIPKFGLEYGRDIIDMDLAIDAGDQVTRVETTCWDSKNQELLSGEKDSISTPSHGNLSGEELAKVGDAKIDLKHTGKLSQQELDNWAEGYLLKSRMAKVKGTIKCQGDHKIKPGEIISLGGLGDRFNGNAFITGVQHSLGQGDWISTIQIGFSPRWHYQEYEVSQEPAAGFNAPINGLHIGVITKLEGDPNGNERVQVKLPIVDFGDEGTWARLTSADAGENRGFVWRPEINDEVVVGFLNDDPNQAVILGSLFSSTKPTPFVAADDNFEKGWISKSEIKLLINDENKTIEITTPNDNKILLSDEEGGITFADESGNKIVMNSDGISIESSKDILLKAIGDFKLEGVNIEMNANVGFKANGSSTAELTGGGQTTIKGGLVNIN